MRQTTGTRARVVVLAAACAAACGGSSTAPGAADGGGGGGDAGGDPLVVDTDQGPVRGEAAGDLRVFRGIPYAAAPVGDLRFRPPAPAPARDGVLDALELGPVCPQLERDLLDPGDAGDEVTGDEDCLRLNIWAHGADEAARPVMLFIHGGGFQQGSSSQPTYEGAKLAAAGDVLVVTINYRLGALGLMATEQLADESGDDTAGNQAIRDQIAALDWVSANIARFGGDPGNVTIFGESAGGVSVCVLAGSPVAEGLFARAIVESGVCHGLPRLRSAQGAHPAAVARGAEIAEAAGCGGDADELACLRALPAEDLVRAGAMGASSGLGLPEYSPSIDGVVVTGDTFDLFESGARELPLLLGSNADEGTLFNAGTPVATWLGFDARVHAKLGEEIGDQVIALYPHGDYDTPKQAWNQLFGELGFVCPIIAMAENASSGDDPAYAYHFTRVPGGEAGNPFGAFHGAELMYAFGNFGDAFPPGEADLALSDRMQAAWTSFARGGAPMTSPAWPAYGVGGDVFVFEEPPEIGGDVTGGRCAAFQELGLIPTAQ